MEGPFEGNRYARIFGKGQGWAPLGRMGTTLEIDWRVLLTDSDLKLTRLGGVLVQR